MHFFNVLEKNAAAPLPRWIFKNLSLPHRCRVSSLKNPAATRDRGSAAMDISEMNSFFHISSFCYLIYLFKKKQNTSQDSAWKALQFTK